MESDPPKKKATTEGKTPNTKKSDPPKRKATTPGKTPNKKNQRCDISDANLDAQLKQVSVKNANDSVLLANDSLLCATTKSNQVLHHSCSRQDGIRMVGGLSTVDAEQTTQDLH